MRNIIYSHSHHQLPTFDNNRCLVRFGNGALWQVEVEGLIPTSIHKQCIDLFILDTTRLGR